MNPGRRFWTELVRFAGGCLGSIAALYLLVVVSGAAATEARENPLARTVILVIVGVFGGWLSILMGRRWAPLLSPSLAAAVTQPAAPPPPPLPPPSATPPTGQEVPRWLRR